MGLFDQGKYFDVVQEVAKRTPEDILWRITVTNRGPKSAPIHILPTLWFRNIWSWGENRESPNKKPAIMAAGTGVVASHEALGEYRFLVDSPNPKKGVPWLFTENDTNSQSVFGTPNASPHVKDAFHRYLIHGEKNAVSPIQAGTKAAAHLKFMVPPGVTITVRCRLHLCVPSMGTL